MGKDTQTIHRLLAANCLSLFDNFVSLALKGLIKELDVKNIFINLFFTKSLKRTGKKRNKCDWLTFRQSLFKKNFMRIPECFQNLLPISTKSSNIRPSVNFSELDFFSNIMKKITSDYWYEKEGSPFWHNPLVDLQNIANLANLRTINNIHTNFFFNFC